MKFFSDICLKCLNTHVRISKIVNKHTVDYHPSSSEFTSRIHPLIFLWTLKGFIFSPECFLNFFSNLYFVPWQWKSFKFMVLRLLENAFVSQKVESFLLMSLSTNLPQVLIIATPGRRKLTIFSQTTFFSFFLSRKGEELKNDQN